MSTTTDAARAAAEPLSSAVPSRRIVIAAGEQAVHSIFVPAARALRGRGWHVDQFTTFLRERALLARAGEPVIPARLPDEEAAVPDALRPAARLRALVGGVREGPALDRYVGRVLSAARDAVAHADAAIAWNGGPLDAACIALAARERGIPCVFAESGVVPDALQLDPQGVNFASRAAHLVRTRWREHEPHELPDVGRGGVRAPGPWRPTRWWLTIREILEGVTQPERMRFSHRARFRAFFWRGRRTTPLPGDAAPLPDRFVFVPLQVHDDTQILFHGRWVDSMETFLRTVIDAAGDVPVIVREHPVDTVRFDYRALERAVPGATWTRTRDLRACLERASAVVTMNSTVGLEALAAGRPLVVCGDAIFDVDGVVQRAATRDDVQPALQRALSTPLDADAAARLLGAIRRHLHVDVHWRDPDRPSVERVVDRIEELIAAEAS